MIGRGHTHSVASLPTKKQQECMPLWLLTEPSFNTETLGCPDSLHLFKLKSFYSKLMFFFRCILDEVHFYAVVTELKTSALCHMRTHLLVFMCSETAKCNLRKCYQNNSFWGLNSSSRHHDMCATSSYVKLHHCILYSSINQAQSDSLLSDLMTF